MVSPPPDDMTTSADIAAFGETLAGRFADWRASALDSDFSAVVDAYFGRVSRHELLERTVWHSTQHVRQIASLLEQAGVAPERAVTAELIRGLPLTERIWDED